MVSKAGRVVHLTFYKCASQWVRDILTDPEMTAVTGFPLSLNSVDVATSPWPEQPFHTFAGPIYGASYEAWLRHSHPDDRAIVVIRDPRDIVVSLMYSVAFNHAPTINTLLLRPPMEHASTKDRLRLGMHLVTAWSDHLKSWSGYEKTGREYLTGYKEITENPEARFREILEFVGWTIPNDVFHRVLDRFSFEKMTGRRKGEANVFSHHRKGVDGDWRLYFDRETGYEFEETFPGLLKGLGFEGSNDWYQRLPEHVGEARDEVIPEPETGKLLARIAQLEHLHQEVIDVRMWEKTAEERLADIERLTGTVERLRANFAERKAVAEERLADILKLNALVSDLQEAADKRLSQVHELTSAVNRTNVLADERLMKMLELTDVVHQLEDRAVKAEQDAQERFEQVHVLARSVREAQREAEERLEDVTRLTAAVRTAEETAGERLADITRLHGELAETTRQAELRLADVATLNESVRAAEQRVAEQAELAARWHSIAEERLAFMEELVRTAEERLAAIHALTAAAGERQNAADERLADIHKLTAMVHASQATADERLAALESLTAQHRQLQSAFSQVSQNAEAEKAQMNALRASLSYRFGFRPLAAMGALLRKLSGSKEG